MRPVARRAPASSSWCKERGVTLIELLIAVTLLSLLVAGVLTAIRVGLNAMAKTNARFLANRRAAGAQRILERQLAGFLPVSAECNAAAGPAPTAKIPFFQGEPQLMRFVSTYSLEAASRGRPQILELLVIPANQGRGVRLVVNEHLYTGALGAGRFCLGLRHDPAVGAALPHFVPAQFGPQSFVLADQLAACRFLYREPLPPPLFERWVDRWIQSYWPTAVRIEMTPLETDVSRISPSTLTLPLFVNRVPLGVYFD